MANSCNVGPLDPSVVEYTVAVAVFSLLFVLVYKIRLFTGKNTVSKIKLFLSEYLTSQNLLGKQKIYLQKTFELSFDF